MAEKNKREVAFWDSDPDVEVLYNGTLEEAIEAFLEDSGATTGEITFYGFSLMEVPEPTEYDAMRLVEGVFEEKWEEYQGEDGVDITDNMVAAALTFLKVLHEEFVPWPCEITTEENVDIAAWLESKQNGE